MRLVYEALHERQRLRRNAPHLVKLLPFMIPILTKDGLIPRRVARALGSAMWMYDLTGGFRIGKLHKRLKADAAFAHLPTMPRDRLAGGYLYYDATTDDARLVLTIARTAAAHGAVVANRCRVVALTKGADGQVDGAVVDAGGRRDRRRGPGSSSTPPACGPTRSARSRTASHPDSIRPAKGVHLTVPWEQGAQRHRRRHPGAQATSAACSSCRGAPQPDGTFEHTYIGTTDTDYDGPLDDPPCTADDIAYVLGALNDAVTTDVTVDDVTGVWAGLRPLVKSATQRAHRRPVPAPPRHDRPGRRRSAITGGKLTTYREMAEDTVDEVLGRLGRKARCRTKRLRLLGADGYAEAAATARRPPTSAAATARWPARSRRCRRRPVARRAADPGPAVPAGRGGLRGARTRWRRRSTTCCCGAPGPTSSTVRRPLAAAPVVAELLAGELGWDADETTRQVAAYRGPGRRRGGRRPAAAAARSPHDRADAADRADRHRRPLAGRRRRAAPRCSTSCAPSTTVVDDEQARSPSAAATGGRSPCTGRSPAQVPAAGRGRRAAGVDRRGRRRRRGSAPRHRRPADRRRRPQRGERRVGARVRRRRARH